MGHHNFYQMVVVIVFVPSIPTVSSAAGQIPTEIISEIVSGSTTVSVLYDDTHQENMNSVTYQSSEEISTAANILDATAVSETTTQDCKTEEIDLFNSSLKSAMNTKARSTCEQEHEMPKTAIKKLFLGLHVEECTTYTCGSNVDCKCDSKCLLYGDCCHEFIEKLMSAYELNETAMFGHLLNRTAFYRSIEHSERFAKELFIYQHSTCVSDERQSKAYWMINRCPPEYSDINITHKCQNGDFYGVDNIPLEWTDRGAKRWLFKNIFCALCHGLALETNVLERWKIDVYCTTEEIDGGLSSGTVNLFNLPPECSVEFSPPVRTSDQRRCQAITPLGTSCHDIPFKTLCYSYLYTVKSNHTMYRNPHCVVCNDTHENYSTICPRSDNSIHENAGSKVDLQMLFDFSPNTGYTIEAFCKQKSECLSFEIYDCISDKCRPLYCLPNQMAYFGQCIVSNFTDGSVKWHAIFPPTDSGNALKDVMFLQIDLLSPNTISFEDLTDFVNKSDYVEKMYLISTLEERMINMIPPDAKAEANLEDFIKDPTIDGGALGNGEQPVKNWDEDTSNGRPKTNFDGPNTFINSSIGNLGLGQDQNISEIRNDKENTNLGMAVDYRHPMPGWTTNNPQNGMDISTSSIHNTVKQNNDESDEYSKSFDDNGLRKELDTHQFRYNYEAKIIVTNPTAVIAKSLLKAIKHEISNSNWSIVSHLKISVRSYTSLQNLHCDTGNLTVLYNVSYSDDMKDVNLLHIQANASVNDIVWVISEASAGRQSFDTVAACISQYQLPDLNCSLTSYEKHEVIFVNNTMYVKNATLVFKESEYQVLGSKVFVCINKLRTTSFVLFFNYSEFQRTLSIITSSISLICLASICLLHIIFSKLRNNHGLNLLSLSSSMLLVQVMLLLENIPAGTLCTAYATCLHFLVLSMFIWMNVIGFDMAITFHSKTMIRSKTNIARFIKYCAVAIILPLVCIGTCLLLEVSHARFSPGYGVNGICWITNSASIIIFFTVPIFASIIVNMILFSVVLYSIQHAKVKSSTRTSGRNRAYSLVYFKMSIILGFTWIVGIIAAFVSVDWLWYIHIILNGLQGLSLFLCSMVNARTVRVLKEGTQTMTFSDTRSSKVDK